MWSWACGAKCFSAEPWVSAMKKAVSYKEKITTFGGEISLERKIRLYSWPSCTQPSLVISAVSLPRALQELQQLRQVVQQGTWALPGHESKHPGQVVYVAQPELRCRIGTEVPTSSIAVGI